jgi:hypothetical protein
VTRPDRFFVLWCASCGESWSGLTRAEAESKACHVPSTCSSEDSNAPDLRMFECEMVEVER